MNDDELRHIGATAHNCWLGVDDEVDAGRRFVAECNFAIVPVSPVRSDREALVEAAQAVCDVDAWQPEDPVPGWYLTEECGEWQDRRREAIDKLRTVLAELRDGQKK